MDTPPRAATRFERDGSTVRFGEGPSRVSLTFCTPRIARVELMADGPDPGPSYVVPRQWPATPVEVHEGEPVRLGTSDLRLEVSTSPLRLSFLDAAGNWLLREPDEGGGMTRERTTDGRARVHARFAFSGEQHFYGLGQGGGQLDRLGTSRQLWNTHIGHGPGSDMGVPLLLSNRGYAAVLRQLERRPARGGPVGQRRAHRLRGRRGALCLVFPDRPRPARRHAGGGRAPGPGPAAAALGARLPPVDPALRRHRRAAAAAAHDPREAHPVRRARLPLDLRRGARLESRRRAPRVPARALAGSGRPPRGSAGPALRGDHARVPGAPRGVAAVRRGRVARATC